MVLLPFFLFFFPPDRLSFRLRLPGTIFASTPIVFGPNYCEDVRAVKDALQMKKENESKLSSSKVRRFFLRNTSVFCLCGAAQF